jgi:hypothetical protein
VIGSRIEVLCLGRQNDFKHRTESCATARRGRQRPPFLRL